MTHRELQETAFTDLQTSEQTLPKTPWTNKQMDEGNEQKKNTQNTQCFELTKLVIALICVALGVAGTIFILARYYRQEKTPEPQRQISPFGCFLNSTRTKEAKIKFGDPLNIECRASSTIYQIFVNFTSIHNYIKRTEVNFTSNVTNNWMINLQNYTAILVRKAVKCDSSGTFTIIVTNEEYSDTSNIKVEIESKTSQVKLEVGRSNKTDNLYDVSCSTGSHCIQTPIMLLGYLGNQVIPLYGVNFTCIINYNDEDGFSVACTGSIPADIVDSLNGIMCRPDLKDQMVVNDTEAAVSRDSFYCKPDEDCKFTCAANEEDRYFTDPKLCTIFHRCVKEKLYTTPCGKGTFFDTSSCSCDHKDNVISKKACNSDGRRLVGSVSEKVKCGSRRR